ncbi:uncharacterized protein LOC115066450 [Bactrocera dorsalis]|uniref:Uncharacterized protein LOC115066450 n=1 Tax=Bactrocera dorsalis TaxID=27457 RepID=A0ABM3JA63_BACDO|nr:uncharacterized protein LOC115066450 [Bactrocera dorsalis]XP_049306114.1 uncharacterized protein LOC115066450 [Bactrocera dorsalis]XP_049306115.1 uncharacterized protein LOC115066450 [Bactrocera dorsalis]
MSTISYLKEKYPNCALIIVGDYNLPSSCPQDECANMVYSEMSVANCQQYNKIRNINDRTLDLCFSSIEIYVNSAEAIIDEDKHHPAISIHAEIKANLKTNVAPTYAFKNADYWGLNYFFLRINWIELYKLVSLDDKVNWLYDKISDGIVQFVPVHTNRKSNYPCWFSRELIGKIQQKKDAHATYKRLKTSYAYNVFRRLRSECKRIGKGCYNAYTSRMEELVRVDTSQFWEFIKSRRRNNMDIPSTVSWKDSVATTGGEVSNLFASFFGSIYAGKLNDNGEPMSPAQAAETLTSYDVKLSELTFRFDKVYEQMCKLDGKKGAGPDGIPNILLKSCAVGQGETVHTIYTDFDMVDHELLIEKMDRYEVAGNVLSWFNS